MIESQLLSHLIADKTLGPMLATYNGKPAIFEQTAPGDKDKNWSGKQFSRIIYDIDTEASPARKTTGTLRIDVESTDSSTQFDAISPVLKAAIDGYFFSSDDGNAVAARWLRSDNFTTDESHSVFGCTHTYDLYAFPVQNVEDSMDPVAVINTETKKQSPDAKVIGVDTLDNAWAPTDAAPAIYWRSSDVRSDPAMSNYDSWAVAWLQVTMQGHVFAPSQTRRNSIVKRLGQVICQGQRLLFADGSPLTIRSMRIDNGADPLRDGQITVIGSYGVLQAQVGGGTPLKIIKIS
ncbi:MAG TPA: hypothetical protein DC001_02790 [Clostridiales bacterium]|nr:hypothetical protein [Clostridiales bacterium]